MNWFALWLPFFIVGSVAGQFVEPNLCSGLCLCYTLGNMVDCSRSDQIGGIPNNIKSDYNRLVIQYGKFYDRSIGPRNFTHLKHLTELKIIYCRITTIAPNTFKGMIHLRRLDLSYNDLGIIVPRTFVGLNLKALHLQQNPSIGLLSKSFEGMNASEVHLRSSNIHHIQYETFAKIHLSKLFLYNNSIRELDRRFGDLLNDPNKLIDLTANPLHCTCQISWIVQFLQRWSLGSPSYKSINITCGSPMTFVGREMKSINVRELPCPKPRIEAVSIEVKTSGTAQLICTASGSPAPGLSWSYIESSGNRRELRRIPEPVKYSSVPKIYQSTQDYLYPPNTNRVETSLTVNVTLISTESRAYTCTAWNEVDERRSVVIRIRGPQPQLTQYPFSKNTIYGDSPSIQRNEFEAQRPLLLDEKKIVNKEINRDRSPSNSEITSSNYIFQKQFTLLEMIGAVVGTFTATLAFLLLLSRCITLCRSETSKSKKTYWSTHGSAAYSAAGSHEYDVPRIDHVVYQPAKMDEIEFLDFKTQRKLYNSS